VSNEATSADYRQAGVPGGRGAATAVKAPRTSDPTVKGGISAMAKKTAKGGKKKGGKKR
jgi:hypothetical protein